MSDPTSPSSVPRVSRRAVLAGAAVAAGATVLDVRSAHAEPVRRDPFTLGVASGDPLPNGVVIWTRLTARGPAAGSRCSGRSPPTRGSGGSSRRGVTVAHPALAHSVHVDVRGLAPAREYWYRFRAGHHLSPVGRAKTAPAWHAHPRRLRLGVVNCQDFQNGYWPAYAGLAEEDLDAVVHLGDYIYEYDPHSVYADRRHTAPQTPGLDQLSTLADYRARHAQYKSDPALQAAHAAFSWIVTWDDHEVENNYADRIDEQDTGAAHQTPEQLAVQRAAAYQAYYEHMPLRRRVVPGSPFYRLFRRFDFGDLLRLNVLDTRQYRTDQPPGVFADFGPVESGLNNTAGTLTGTDQGAWLRRGPGALPGALERARAAGDDEPDPVPELPRSAAPAAADRATSTSGTATTRSASGCCSSCGTRRSSTRSCWPATSTRTGSATCESTGTTWAAGRSRWSSPPRASAPTSRSSSTARSRPPTRCSTRT